MVKRDRENRSEGRDAKGKKVEGRVVRRKEIKGEEWNVREEEEIE